MVKMVRKISFAMTQGVASLMNDDSFKPKDVEGLFRIALHHSKDSYFISFKTNGINTLVTDGDNNVLGNIPFPIPENIWMIQDGSEDETVVVATLPSEY